ncbi:MAG: ABC transporter ATP-binding protein [Oscillospiraceae bacterium]|nr:ABC transporter ATP-binding protein [Oscillospiraceae bacterium]
MKGLMKYVKPHLWYMALTIAIKFVGTYAELWIPSIMETMLDDIAPTRDVPKIYLFGGLMLLCAAACLVLNITANRMTAFSSGRITKSIRHDLFKKLQSLSARQMDELTIASAESRLTSDTYNVNNMLTRVQRMGIRAPILLIGGIIMMVQMDWVLALVLILLLPIISIIIYTVSRKGLPLYTKQQSTLDDVVLVTQENITGIRVIKALSKTEHEKKRFEKVNTELSEVSQKAGRVTAINGPATTAVMRVGLTLVVLVGALRVNSGAIEAGVIIAALQYFTMIINAATGITRIFIMWTRGEASAKRVSSVLELPEDMALEEGREPEENAPHIEFRDVTFSYTGVGKNLDKLNFKLEAGQTLGILGGTGSGKTTILNLLMRLYDVDEGQILIGGKDIKTISEPELRKKFGIVFQNDFVTEGTIAHNIRFFRDISDEDVQKAADCAQASFIAEKEGGMEAEVVIRGNNLSGGQKQRLLIARALAADPEILVLDDASSALDYQTDANLRRALRENYRNTTTVLVTQRVSSLRHADLILVLSDGEVIGAGDHRHLMENCEEYRHIANTQMHEEGSDC